MTTQPICCSALESLSWACFPKCCHRCLTLAKPSPCSTQQRARYTTLPTWIGFAD